MSKEEELQKKITSLKSENELLLDEIEVIFNRIKIFNTIENNKNLIDNQEKRVNKLLKLNNILESQLDLLAMEVKFLKNSENLLQKLGKDIKSCKDLNHKDISHEINKLYGDDVFASVPDYDNLYKHYTEKGIEAFEILLESKKFTNLQKAFVCTILAYKIKFSAPEDSARLYHRAWLFSPSPLRMKNMAFAYWYMGDITQACACARLISDDTHVSEEERKTLENIKNSILL